MHPKYHPELRLGQKFRLPPDCCSDTVYEVVRVSEGSVLVRPAKRIHREITDGVTGEVKASFDAPAGAFTISKNSSVVVIEEEE